MTNNAIQSRLMGQAISSRMFSGYAQANNIRLAQVVSKKLTAAQEASGLHPTLDSLHTPLRPKALSFEQSAFLKNYRNNMLDLQSTAAQATAARTRQTLAAGSSDPADAAMLYGEANAALGALWFPLTKAFKVKDGRARVKLDFDASGITVYGVAALSIKIGTVVWVGLRAGWQALFGALAAKKRLKLKRQQRKAA